MNLWCMDIPNKPHLIVIEHHQRRCYICNKELPHFTILHSLPKIYSNNSRKTPVAHTKNKEAKQ